MTCNVKRPSISLANLSEIIGCLWLICSLLAFGFGFDIAGWCLLAKACADFLAWILLVILEFKEGQ